MDIYEIEIEQLAGERHRWFVTFNSGRIDTGYADGFHMAVEAAQHAIDASVKQQDSMRFARP